MRGCCVAAVWALGLGSVAAQDAVTRTSAPNVVSATCPVEAPVASSQVSGMNDTRRVPASFMASRILKHPGPIYPKIAKVKHISGVVMLHAVIGKDGTMEKVDPLCGPELLLPSAIEAAKQWTYTPFDDIDGKPLEVETTITMDYAFGPSAVPKPGSGSWINGVEVVDIPEGSPELDGAKRDKPKYPKNAKKAGVVGVVKVVVLIGTDGKVESAKAVSGPDALQPAAEETVKKYRYRKYMVNGVPKMVRTTETVTFSLTS